MHKPILRRVGLVLVLVSLLDLAWTLHLARDSHAFSFDFTFLVAGICLLFGRLSTARFIRRLSALVLVAAGLGLAVLVGFAVYSLATQPISSTMEALRGATLESPEDLITAVVWVAMCAWTFRELSRPENLGDGKTPVPQQQPTTSTGQPVRYRRARAGR